MSNIKNALALALALADALHKNEGDLAFTPTVISWTGCY